MAAETRVEKVKQVEATPLYVADHSNLRKCVSDNILKILNVIMELWIDLISLKSTKCLLLIHDYLYM